MQQTHGSLIYQLHEEGSFIRRQVAMLERGAVL